MADGSSFFQQLDHQLEKLLSEWSVYTTIISLTLLACILYPVLFNRDPDTHPLLLSRQASASPVRQPGESAVYRSSEIPHGYPLRSGLNVKDPGAPKWTSGRDGDIRDVWKQAVRGPADADGKSTGTPGKFLTILGKEAVVEFGFIKLTREMNAVGKFVKNNGSRVAMYLPNSVEFIVTLFAAAFYGFTPILIPQGQSLERLAELLTKTQSDVLVAGAGTIPLKELVKHCSGLKQVVWVVEQSSRHIDWTEVPESIGSKAKVLAWHDIVDQKDSSSETPPDLPENAIPDIVAIYEDGNHGAERRYEIVNFTQKNIVAAIAAQLSAVPKNHRLGPGDLLLPLDSLTNIWTLTIVLAALFSNSSLALTSVMAHKAKYDMAFQAVSPTVVVASTQTMVQAYKDGKAAATGITHSFKHWTQARSLTSGIMPKPSGITPKPRLIYISNRPSADEPPLEHDELSDLRIITGARIIYAFIDVKVAGAVAQTQFFDYRHHANEFSKHSHFGPPVSAVEIKLEEDRSRSSPLGRPIVSGPAVVGGETKLGHVMTFTDSNTLAYT